MGAELRVSAEDPRVPVSASNFLQFFGYAGTVSETGIVVTVENALGVPAIWAAVNFLAGTMASLPIHVYRRTRAGGQERVRGPVEALLRDAFNDETSAFEGRKYVFDQAFTRGRGIVWVERAPNGRPLNLWPLDVRGVQVRRDASGRKVYGYRAGNVSREFAAGEVIDLHMMLAEDGLAARSPIIANRDVVGMAIAATQFGSKFFQNGGVPPFVMTGPFASGAAMQRAAGDLEASVREATRERRQALVIPSGHDIKALGVDPDKSQLVELQRFLIEQVARIYSLPPTFLQDLTHGTYSNTEQQDLHLAKHTIARWVRQAEAELSLKLFGRGSGQFVRFNLDGLLRGDFRTRMEGYAAAIQHGVLQPNEARELENRPAAPFGDGLFMQGAMAPIGSLGATPAGPQEGDDGA